MERASAPSSDDVKSFFIRYPCMEPTNEPTTDIDEDLKGAIEECARIIQERCKNRPFMVVISKANVKFKTEEDKKKGLLKGTATYMYMAKPALRKNGLSKLLIDTSRVALSQAEKKIMEEPES
jgi:hypothetical protein